MGFGPACPANLVSLSARVPRRRCDSVAQPTPFVAVTVGCECYRNWSYGSRAAPWFDALLVERIRKRYTSTMISKRRTADNRRDDR